MNNNRNRGNNFERECVNDMKNIGFDKAVSSRAESRNMDAAKVDICFTEPFYFQCKNMLGHIKYEDILETMPKTENINVILHKKTKKAKTSFMTTGKYAILKYSDFLKVLKMLQNGKVL